MAFHFLKTLIGVKTDQAIDGAMTALVRMDPTAATEAELRTMEQALDELGVNVAKARQAFEKGDAAADTAKKLYAQRLTAAEQISAQVESEQDPGKKATLNKSLETLIGMLEKSKSDVDVAVADAGGAKEFLDLLQTRYEEAGQKLKGARADLDRAKRDMDRSEERKHMAEERAEGARQAAGLVGASGNISTALKAMQDVAAQNQAKADAATSKANLLTPSHPEKEDPVIAAALADAAGSKVPASLSDRLAALRPAHAA